MSSAIINANKKGSKKTVSSLLKASIPESVLMAIKQVRGPTPAQFDEIKYFQDMLVKLGHTSIFDITRISRSRFIYRYDGQLLGRAGEIYDKAASFTTQVIQKYRKGKLRKNNNKNVGNTRSTKGATNESGDNLPCYADLFPESWLDFCRSGEVQAVDSPVSYLVDLYRFIQEIEADSSTSSITLDKRRPDIAQLPLNYDTTYQELPELDFVNAILMLSIQNFLNAMDDGPLAADPTYVYGILDSTRFPFALPYSFPNDQIHSGLAVKDCTLNQLVQTEGAEASLPWEMTQDQRDNVLFAASKLSNHECILLTEAATFSQYQVTAEQLDEGYLTGSTTEIMPGTNLDQHGYLVPLGALVPPYSALTPDCPDHFDEFSLTCLDDEGLNPQVITLRGESVLTYQRVKARMVEFEASDDTHNKRAYSRQLRLSSSDIPVDLSAGPYFGSLDVDAQTIGGENFAQLRFAFSLTEDTISASDLWTGSADYFLNNYGIKTEAEYSDLKQITEFAQSVSGTAVEVEQLLAQGDYRPQVSPNVVFDNTIFSGGQSALNFPDSYHYGAKYINNACPSALSIEIKREADGNGWREIDNTSPANYERINRFLRLARWSALPHDKLDLLLNSVMQAEVNSTGDITPQTIKAYGLYCHLNERYSMTVEAFSTMFDNMSVYSISPEVPFFDRIFNNPQLFDDPFVQDTTEFDYTDPLDANVKQICSGLAISTTSFLLLAPLVQEAFNIDPPFTTNTTLNRTAPVLSALYRLVNLPALFGLSPEEGLDLLKILSKVLGLNETLVTQLVIQPRVEDAAWDTTGIILQLEQLAAFMRESGFTTANLLFLLEVNASPLVSTQGMVDFFSSMQKQLTGEVLLSEASFQRPELPSIPVPAIQPPPPVWMNTLASLITPEGLVRPYPEEWGLTDAEYLNQELVAIVEALQLPDDDNENIDADTVAVLEQIISQAKSAQDNLVATAISNEYGVSREQVNPLLSWCNSSVMDICTLLLETDLTAKPLDPELFTFAYDVLLHVGVMSKFNLSENALFMRLAQPAWLNLAPVTTAEITLKELWILNDYTKLLSDSSYSEQEIQDYFATANINGETDSLDDFDYATLMADILAWNVEEVLNATADFIPPRATNMLQINWLSQIQQLSAQTGMSAYEVISASALAVDSILEDLKPVGQDVVAASKEDNESLGEHLASSLRDALVGYYLDQLVPNDDDMAPYRDWLKTVDTLYDFLLLDTQVSYKVKTAGVAQATKSLQQYINRITLNLEPGLKTTLEETLNWREFANRYGYWAGNQQLKIYPEVYIDPTLRLGKTDLFFQLESVLNQGKLEEETVENAVLGYLNAFEEVSNLEVLSGYESGGEIAEDKMYFVAKTRTQPYLYYWRSLDMTQGIASTLDLYPSAWEEWKHIALPLDAAIPRTVRPVILNSRLYVAWIEVSKEEKDTGVIDGETGQMITTTSFITKLMLAHLKFDGTWSTPNLLKEEGLDYQITDLIAVMDTTRAEEKLMLVGYISNIGDDGPGFYDYTTCFAYACDTMLIESTDFPASPKPTFSDIDYYSDKLIWFYTRDAGNLYFEGEELTTGGIFDPDIYPPLETTTDQAWARKEKARKLILYPYVNTTEWPIEDTYSITGPDDYPVSGGKSGTYGKDNIEILPAFTADDINRLSITAKAPDYNYFEDPSVTEGDNLTVVLFCIWVWERSPEGGNDITTGRLLYKDYRAYYNPDETPIAGADSYPTAPDEVSLSAVIELESGWGDVVVQAGFSLVKDEIWQPGDPYYIEDNGGRFTATYTVGKKLRELVQNRVNNKVEYLQFPESYKHHNNDAAIRLNTLFAKELISRATKGIDYVLEWETQNLDEPPVIPGNADVPIDFNGANGIYFWELFFHMPYLVAWRLNIEQRYEEAAQWAQYIFNPSESLDQPELAEGKPRYWNCRPLSPLEDDDDLNRALTQPADPDAIAESDPVHYRKAIFRFYVDNLIDQGDKEYRKQDPSSRIVARLSYDTAGALLDQRPDIQMATTWETCILEDAANNNESEQREEEMNTLSLRTLPVTYDGTISNQDNGLFLDPFNSKLTELWDTLEQRLYNLRHNLTIDGKEMSTQLYETPVDPMALQSQRYQRVVALNNAGAAKFVVPNYRFEPMMNKAMNGVETLIQFGSTLLGLLERKDGLNFDSFQMNQQLAMYNFTISLQQQSIEISEAELSVSEVSRESADQRYQHYKKLYDENISSTEHEVVQLQASAASALISAQGMRTAAAALDMIPNMFGLACGGMNWGAPLNAMAEATTISYQSDSAKAESLSVSESYRRRRQEWQIQYKQAELEITAIDKQMEVQQRQVQAGQTQLEQIEAEYEQSQELFEYFSSRFTNENLYIWMTSQLSNLYLQAYDAVMSLCLTTEASWQYEIGQFESQFVQPGVWNDLYQGLLVGETMKLGLIQMDQAYAYQNIRRQEITKTISLKDHMPDGDFEKARDSNGKFVFNFNISQHFANDFIGLKNQRIESVAISLPTLVGPYQDIKATLTQLSSIIDGSVGTERKQVILSHGVEDNGMFTFNDDGRFLPFEGTGVESSWTLEFSQGQDTILDNLTDVIFHMNYTAITV
ncbi:Tc toxin subunit A [Shewanella sp. YLB-07]|uniref:Tc toxin subunit A n=1 Tax=Shewanella sp. YLB-07 TaxID=2601268 RepID=UPI00128BF44C|nr:Tc toxin subunit A [Shewanella sp. YLB-07]MPY26926.1 hypothetical protein [Shewanella sp. YLB-07]